MQHLKREVEKASDRPAAARRSGKSRPRATISATTLDPLGSSSGCTWLTEEPQISAQGVGRRRRHLEISCNDFGDAAPKRVAASTPRHRRVSTQRAAPAGRPRSPRRQAQHRSAPLSSALPQDGLDRTSALAGPPRCVSAKYPGHGRGVVATLLFLGAWRFDRDGLDRTCGAAAIRLHGISTSRPRRRRDPYPRGARKYRAAPMMGHTPERSKRRMTRARIEPR